MLIPDGLDQLVNVSVTIANGASLSDVADLKGYVPVGFVMPAAWTAAALTFLGSDDNSTFSNLYSTTAELSIATVVVDARVLLPVGFLTGCGRYFKIRSGVAATPVNQGAARTIKILCLPV